MKKRIFCVLLLILTVILSISLTSCEELEDLIISNGGNFDEHFKDVNMPLIYDIYLDYMEEIGEEPLPYDEWFELVGGNEFQKGIIPLIEKNKDSEFWEISFNNGKGWNDLRFKTENEEHKKCKHSFGKWVIVSEADDYFSGIRYRECKKCHYRDYQFKIDKDKDDHEHTHEFLVVTTAPTCEAGGFDTKTCSGCDYEEILNETVPLGHGYTDEYLTDADCHWQKCSRCEHTTEKEEHQRGDGDKCGVCGYIKNTAEATPDEYFIFTLLDDGTYSVKAKNVNNMPNNVVIPATYNGKAVTVIGHQAFCDCSSISSITIPNSITSIDCRAFFDCDSLESIIIPNSVTSIGNYAFGWCTSLTSVTIGNSVTYIGDHAFYDCSSLTSITVDENNQNYKSIDGNLYSKDGTTLIQYAIGKKDATFEVPYGVTYIKNGAFENCHNIVNVIIPCSVTYIGSYTTFLHCYNLATITVAESNQHYKSIDGNLYNKDGTTLVMYAIGKKGAAFEVPYGVTSIGNSSFRDCSNIVSVIISPSVTDIGSQAFENCSALTSMVIGDSITSIGEYAFYDCSSLTSITIPDSVKTIGGFAFAYCSSLTSITIPDSVTSIGNSAFYNCSSLTSTTVDENNQYYKSIDGNLYTKDGTTLIQYAIGKKDTAFIIPDSVEFIGNGAFLYCTSLTSVTIPDSVTSIGDYAFYHCDSLTSITIGNGVTSIGNSAFYNCYSLTSITIGNGVTSIGNSAFYNCYSLTDVYYTGTEEEWAAIFIDMENEWLTDATIHYNYVPEE